MGDVVAEGFWGEPGYGKTTLSMQRAVELAGERAVPVIFFDVKRNLRPRGALEFRGVPAAAIVDPVWTDGNHVVYSPPPDPLETERFFQKVWAGGNVCLMVDEVSKVGKGATASPALLDLCTTHRAQGVDLFFTSTQPQDLHASAWSAITKTFVFRMNSAFALDRIKRELSLSDADVQTIRSLQKYQYLSFPPEGGL